MGYKFRCENCGNEIITEFLKIGEMGKCYKCDKMTEVPENAVETEEKRSKQAISTTDHKSAADRQSGKKLIPDKHRPWSFGCLTIIVGFILVEIIWSVLNADSSSLAVGIILSFTFLIIVIGAGIGVGIYTSKSIKKRQSLSKNKAIAENQKSSMGKNLNELTESFLEEDIATLKRRFGDDRVRLLSESFTGNPQDKFSLGDQIYTKTGTYNYEDSLIMSIDIEKVLKDNLSVVLIHPDNPGPLAQITMYIST